MSLAQKVDAQLRDVPNFPKEGIVFKDITPVLENPALFAEIIDSLADRYRGKVDKIAGIESRGFIFGAPLAKEIGVGFVLIRKPGKLPAEKIGVDYELEYGSDRLEIHTSSIEKNDRVLIIDDLLATGGTAAAAESLIKKCGGNLIEMAFLIELGFLKGGDKLATSRHSILVL